MNMYRRRKSELSFESLEKRFAFSVAFFESEFGFGAPQDVDGSSSRATGVTMGDLDADGDEDAFVIYGGVHSGDIWRAMEVWLNDGDGFFTKSQEEFGDYYSSDVALGDLDGDGDVDALVAAHGGNSDEKPNLLWLNDGTGKFAQSAVVAGHGDSSAVAINDLDGDGDLDAFITNFYERNQVWINRGDGSFTEKEQTFGDLNGVNVALEDLDGDGDIDAFVSGLKYLMDGVLLNDGAAQFTDTGQRLFISPWPDGDFGSVKSALGDVDGDGDVDAFVIRHSLGPCAARESPRLT